MIRVRKLSEEPGEPEREDGSQGVGAVDIVLRRSDVAAFGSRLLRLEPGGHTAYHAHDREHVALVTSGRCRVETDAQVENLAEGTVVSIPSGTPHRFYNPGPGRLALLVLNLYPPEKVREEKKGPEIEYEPRTTT